MVCVFARATSEPLASLVKKIESKIGEKPSLKSFVVVIPKKADDPTEAIRKLATDAGIKKVPLTIGESPDGPPDYEIARDADFTVLMWKQSVVKVNRAYKGALTAKEIDDIVAEISTLLGD